MIDKSIGIESQKHQDCLTIRMVLSDNLDAFVCPLLWGKSLVYPTNNFVKIKATVDIF